jgi:asparagine synthase (glutamine-hydrolysing)
MCGITGYFNASDYFLDIGKLKRATDTIGHRGPDDAGFFVEDNVGLGHRRLSIIDLSPSGHQPMNSSNKRYVIAYNGEIYNYLELKAELKRAGYSFVGQSDTEVIVNGFEYWGRAVFEKLNGIFAISIWDKKDKKLVLARDRMGVKPLYYWHKDNFLIFGSEIKTILSYGIVKKNIDRQAFHEFLYFGYALGKNTLFSGIKKLMPGQYLEINQEKIEYGEFWNHHFVKELSRNEIRESEAVSKTRTLLEEAVVRQLVSDVPVGVFLSGGIDSSAITAFATKHYTNKIKSYSAGFDFNGGHNELPLASKIAKKFGTEHHELMIQGKDIKDIIKKMVYHHDEPFSDAANIPLYLMTQMVKNDCKVILQGDGGDELFAGYSRYHILSKYYQYQFVFNTLNRLRKIIPSNYINHKTERFLPLFQNDSSQIQFAKFLSEDPEGRPEKAFSQGLQASLLNTNPFERYQEVAKDFDFLSNNVQRLLWIDTKVILPDQFLEKVDKSTMANGVEVRVPFLDNELVNFALSLPSEIKVKNGRKKYILKKALEGIVPNEVLYGPKKGFGVPYQNWLKGPLKQFMIDVFNDPKLVKFNLFDFKVLNLRIEEHVTGKRDWGFSLWKMLNLCIWLNLYDIEGFE